MSTTVEDPKPQFDAASYIAKANETEALRRAGKPVAAEAEKSAPVVEKPIPGEPEHAQHQSRSDRRRMNNLVLEKGRAEGRAAALEDLIAKAGLVKPATDTAAKVNPDPEPQRKDFADDAQYNRSLGRWDARQEASKLLEKKDEGDSVRQQQKDLESQVESARNKFQEDIKLIPDWDAIAKAAEDDDEQPEYVPAEHPGLMTLIATSDSQAFLLAYLAKNPAQMRRLLDLTGKPTEQIQLFRRLEGRAEMVYDKSEKKEEKKPSAAERDAAKPRPSETVVARGGSAAPNKPQMFVKDARGHNVLNPAWTALRNEAEGRRP